MIATAVAHPNIALIKYWGKRDEALNLPAAGSLSLTLAGLATTTTVEFDPALETDQINLDGHQLDPTSRPARRITAFLDLIRTPARIEARARVTSINDFPTAAGLASSASGFAALALAASQAAGLDLSPEELSALARQGSGSAARSIFGGFCEMKPGQRPDGQDAHAVPIADQNHWDLRCLIALTTRGEKKIDSTSGMNHTSQTSPFFQPFIDTVAPDIREAKKAIFSKDFAQLTRIAERSCLRMHASAIAADPGVIYWNGQTLEVVHALREAREEGLQAFFTIDAGPHVKIFCPGDALNEVRTFLKDLPGVHDVLTASPGPGAWLQT